MSDNTDSMVGMRYFGEVTHDRTHEYETRSVRYIQVQVKDEWTKKHIANIHVDIELRGEDITSGVICRPLVRHMTEQEAGQLGAALMNLRGSIISGAKVPFEIMRDHRRYEAFVAEQEQEV